MRARVGLPGDVLVALRRLAGERGVSVEAIAVEIIGDELPSALAAAAEQTFRGGRSADVAPPPAAGPGAAAASGLGSIDASVSLPAGAPITGEASGGSR